MNLRARLLGALTVALVAAGCGSNDLSTGQLRSFATQSCNLASSRTDQIPTPATPDGGASFLSRGIAALTPEQTTLQRLLPPGDLAGQYQTALRASSQELAALRSALAHLRSGSDPVGAIRGLQRRLSPLERRADAAWHSLGIPACSIR